MHRNQLYLICCASLTLLRPRVSSERDTILPHAHSDCWKFIWFPSAYYTRVRLMWIQLEFLWFVQRFCSLKLLFCALN